MKKIICILILSSLICYSCDKDKVTPKSSLSSTVVKKDSVQDNTQIQQNLLTGKQISDFVSNQYEIQYETEGDLNQDGLPEKALILKKKKNT